MKKIFYICTKSVENWDIFVPSGPEKTAQDNLSLLFLHGEHDLRNAPVSQIWYLNKEQKDHGDKNSQKNLSYQGFLEQIFSHDLPVVI